jgi:hypothetical protein
LTQAETAEWESVLSSLQAERQKIVGERAALISRREPLRMECLQLSNALVNAQYGERTLENLLPEPVREEGHRLQRHCVRSDYPRQKLGER